MLEPVLRYHQWGGCYARDVSNNNIWNPFKNGTFEFTAISSRIKWVNGHPCYVPRSELRLHNRWIVVLVSAFAFFITGCMIQQNLFPWLSSLFCTWHAYHDDVLKWEHFQHIWFFVRESTLVLIFLFVISMHKLVNMQIIWQFLDTNSEIISAVYSYTTKI